MLIFTDIVAIVLTAVFLYYVRRRKLRGSLPLPPGPKRLPLIGNLLDMPRGNAWPEYAKWSRELGSNIISLEVFGTVIVVLNTAECANDLLEKKSAMYSNRPHSHMINDLMGWNVNFGFRPYDATWRAQRKFFTQIISPSQPTQFHPRQIASTHDLLRRLRKPSVNVIEELYHWAAITIMDIAYGISGMQADPYIAVAVKSLDGLAQGGAPGAFMVETIPLKYIPEWVPGAGFQTKAREWGQLRANMTEKPFADAKLKIASGIYTESFTSIGLSRIDPTQDVRHQEDIVKSTALTTYAGGTDTVVASINALAMAMLLYPDIQKAAQRELDSVLGHGTLPTFNDQDALPFITAIVREVVRHYPVAPLAIPHSSTEEDVYAGYHIPKGAVIVGNVWSILHDPQTYPNPDVFNPRRFLDANGQLDPNVKDPSTESYAFGFGRRICPGRHVATASLWIATASILAIYNILPEANSQGHPVEPSAHWFEGPTLFNHLLPFQCVFKPRSKATDAAIATTV